MFESLNHGKISFIRMRMRMRISISFIVIRFRIRISSISVRKLKRPDFKCYRVDGSALG